MKSIIIDLNILLDFIFKRDGHAKAAEIFNLCSKKRIQGLICAHEITTLFYFLNKSVKDRCKVKKSIFLIMKHFQIIEINEELLSKALISEISDFEDAVIEVSAIDKSAEYILTRNVKDFRKSTVTAVTPEELIVLLNKNPV